MMVKFAYYLFKTARPRQWLKNLAVFAAIIFTGQLFNPRLLWLTIIVFFIFCAASSANYLFNDVLDAPRDRKHPFKKNRPVASGAISTQQALTVAFSLALASLWAASIINLGFFLITLAFLILEFSYTLVLKKLAVVDILTITGAYILRVYAGEVEIGRAHV
jgi:4-hydroxybenzoate polyprenyltransferase